jgi:hypothetical protein
MLWKGLQTTPEPSGACGDVIYKLLAVELGRERQGDSQMTILVRPLTICAGQQQLLCTEWKRAPEGDSLKPVVPYVTSHDVRAGKLAPLFADDYNAGFRH